MKRKKEKKKNTQIPKIQACDLVDSGCPNKWTEHFPWEGGDACEGVAQGCDVQLLLKEPEGPELSQPLLLLVGAKRLMRTALGRCQLQEAAGTNWGTLHQEQASDVKCLEEATFHAG